jgi:hypothetical protein
MDENTLPFAQIILSGIYTGFYKYRHCNFFLRILAIQGPTRNTQPLRSKHSYIRIGKRSVSKRQNVKLSLHLSNTSWQCTLGVEVNI